MYLRFLIAGALTASSIALFAPAARSQATADITNAITEQDQIANVVRQRSTPGPMLGSEGNEIDGEAGIYVLRVNDIFYLSAESSLGWSENPLRTADDAGDSFYASLAATAGVQTKIAGLVDAGASITVSGLQYDESFAPSSRNVNASANVGYQVKSLPIYIGVVGFGGQNFDEDFDNGTAFYGASASVSYALALGQRTLVQPALVVTRQLSERDENDSTSVTAALTATHVLTPRINLTGSVRVSQSYFDNFFEDVTFVEREDTQYGVSVGATYRLNDAIGFSASVGYDKRTSDFFLSEYESVEPAIAISGRIRF